MLFVGGGEIDSVSDEYAEYYRNLKKKQAQQFREKHPELVKQSRLRSQTKKRQLANPEHNPDKSYTHIDGKIADAQKGEPMTFEQADSGNVNPFIFKQDEKTGIDYIGYKSNCQTCVAAYIARRKGYNVRALPNLNNKSIDDLSHNTSLAFVDKNGNYPAKKTKPYNEEIPGWLSETVGVGEIHSVQFVWSGTNCGHIVTVEKLSNGELLAYDPQTNRKAQGVKDIQSFFKGIRKNSVKTMNLSACELNEAFCDKIMKRSSK